MPLAGLSSWLPEVGSSLLVRDHRESFKCHLAQRTTPQPKTDPGGATLLPGTAQLPVRGVVLSYSLSPGCLEGTAPRVARTWGTVTSPTPFTPRAKPASLLSVCPQGRLGCPSSRAERQPNTLEKALCLFRSELLILVSKGPVCPSWDLCPK